MADTLFATKRTEILNMYAKNGVPFLATTRGLHSTRSIKFTSFNQAAGNANQGYLIAVRGQTLNFFNYGINESIILSGDVNHRATEADTAITKGFQTTASSDLSIEWISMAPRAIKAEYLLANMTDFVAAVPPDPAVDLVYLALQGRRPIVDPFGRVIPVDVGSSATLQHVLYQAIAPFLTCRFEWDNADRTEKLGTCDQFTQGGGASYLNSNGEPSVLNRFRIPEGFLWAREGQPSSQLQVVLKLEDDVVIPYGAVAAPVAGTFSPLQAVHCEICIRLGGLLMRVPGSN